MNQLSYLLSISRSSNAAELHELSKLAAVDGDLSPREAREVRESVGKRFSAINAAALGKPTPRWHGTGAPVRIPTSTRIR